MELIVVLIFGGFVVLVIGAVMGMIAKSRTNDLQIRLTAVERELHRLRGELRAEPPVRQPVQAPPPLPMPAPVPMPTPMPTPVPDLAAAVATPPAGAAAPVPEPEEVAATNRAVAADAVPAPMLPPVPAPTRAEPAPEPVPEPVVAAVAPVPGQFEGVEKALGLRGLTWIGVGMLFLGVAFFLKYAYDRDWLGHLFGPRLRIATAAAAALALAGTGWRSLRNGLPALGQGLLGGGQALLYLTIFAAFQPAAMVVDAPLLGTTAAFVLMVTVTVAGLAVAVRLDAIAMAFLAVLGGFATPVLLRTGQDARDLLCAYLLLLDLGVLGVASYRRWRALDLLAFAGTVVLFGGWFAAWHHAHPQPDATVVWLGVFHLVFVLLPFAHHWRHRTAVTVERFALALANVAWTLGYATWMLREPAPGLLAAMCFCGTLLYLGLGVAVARRVGDDRRTRDGFLALATLLLTLGLLHLLPSNGTTTAWFVEASVLLWLGYRFAHHQTRRAALVVLGVAMLRTLLVHLPDADRLAPFVWNAWFGTLLLASFGLGSFAWLHRRFAKAEEERQLARALGIGAGLWALFVGGREILRHAEGHAEAWTSVGPALAIAWLQLLGALGFLLWAVRWPGRATFLAAFLPLLGAAIAVGVAYDGYPADAWPVVNGPCLAGLGACVVLGLAGRWSGKFFPQAPFAASLYGLLQLAVTMLATVETAVWLQRGGAQPAPQTLGQALGWVWLGLAVGGGLAAAAWASRRMLALAAIPLTLALGTALWQFGIELAPHRLIGNQRFLFAVFVCGSVTALRPLSRRLVLVGLADHFAALALALLLLFGGCEAVTWSCDVLRGPATVSWSVWLVGLTAVAGSLGGWWRARATQNRSLRGVASMALAPALSLPLVVYATEWEAAWMFVNLRAALVAAAVATALRWAHGEPGWRFLRWLAFATGLVGLTVEPPVWLLAHVAERAEAERLALFSVTVTWVITAVVLLVVGFRRNVRPVRLTALALFAVTAVKLLVLDMSGAQQLYRILAFVLTGLVFVGASWLYHRVERRLVAKGGTRSASG